MPESVNARKNVRFRPAEIAEPRSTADVVRREPAPRRARDPIRSFAGRGRFINGPRIHRIRHQFDPLGGFRMLKSLFAADTYSKVRIL